MKEELQAIINKLELQKEEAEKLAKKASFEVKKITAQIKKVQKLLND